MSDYNQFVMAVNKIFEITAKIKAGWKDQDNVNIADSIEDSKATVVEAAKLFNTQAPAKPQATPAPEADLTLEDEDEDTGAVEE
ncbi:MAG: hypothetical protein IJE53_06110 [Bacilli bacterium]|nr:hypothetical protein [Bacilli bacterium]